MLIDLLTDADCTCLRTLAITAHRPCCATCTDHLTKVVQTLYLVYSIYPRMRWVVLRLPTCAFYQASPQPGFHRSYYPRYCQHLLGNRLPHPHLLPRLSRPRDLPTVGPLDTLNDILALVFIYSLVGIFALLLLTSLVYFALLCLEPSSSEP